jgi:protein O-GlcNAc transferase
LEALTKASKLHQAGDLAEAEKLYRAILAHDAGNSEALRWLGLLRYQRGETQAGLNLMQQAVLASPQNADAFHCLGEAYLAQNDYRNAQSCFEKAIEFHPQDLAFRFALIQLCFSDGNHEAVCRQCESIISIDPKHAEAYNYLGLALRELGKEEASLQAFTKSLDVQPLYVDGMVNRANMLRQQGRLDEALALYQRAILVRPKGPSSYNNLGGLLESQGKVDQAIQAYREAIRFDPSFASALTNLANAYDRQELYSLATDAYRQALRCNPTLRAPTIAFTQRLQHLCDWTDLDEMAARVRGMAVTTQPWLANDLMAPFAFICLPNGTTSSEQFQVAKQWGAQFKRPAVPFFQQFIERNIALHHLPSPNQRLRIGYLSADLFNHATAWLMTEMLEQHDRERFEVFGYSIGRKDESRIGLRCTQAFDVFRDLNGVSHQAVAEQIASDGIDILIDLKGYTEGAQPQILAYRPAPIQVNYLGYPGTMGVEFIDYILVDEFVVPRDRAPYYSEKLVYLPGCYQVNDSTDGPALPLPTRRDVGLPEDAIVCCTFNSSYKYHPQMFAVWMRLLQANPQVVLWLVERGPSISERLRDFARSFGIASNRLIFSKSIPHQEHLARISLADLFLDSYPVNAHTTASDALRMGLPVLTLSGEAFVSRVAGSLLNHLGMNDLIANSFEEYERKANILLNSAEVLEQTKQKLRTQLSKSDLFDGEAFARKIEHLYREIWKSYQLQGNQCSQTNMPV